MSNTFSADTEDFAIAARLLQYRGAEPLSRIIGNVTDTLSGCASMAGSDPGGQAWGSSYDRAAQAALAAHVDAVNACYHVAGVCVQSARNYAHADLASSPSRAHRRVVESLASLPPATSLSFVPHVPSAAGGSGGGPPGWGLVESLVGRVWPNGHQDRLRRASRAWRACGAITNDSAIEANMASVGFGIDRLPEFADVVSVSTALTAHLEDLSSVQRAIGAACTEMARHIDTVHSGVERELASLVGSSALIEGVGFAASLVTFGAAEVPAQAVESARIAAAARRIVDLIDTFTQAARVVAVAMSGHAQNAVAVSNELRTFLEMAAKGAPVTSTHPPNNAKLAAGLFALRRLELASKLPPLTIQLPKLLKKYKHAPDFGIHTPYSKKGWALFEVALRVFMVAPRTIRVAGRYRNNEAILNYDKRTKIVVVQDESGAFVTMYKMGRDQYRDVRKRRSLTWMK